jgi:hypothetical protein
MSDKKLGLALFSVLSIMSLPVWAGGEIRDGMWEISSVIEITGIPMPATPFIQSRCFTKQDVNDDAQIIPAVSDQDCKMAEHRRAGGKLIWTVKCTGQNRGSGTGEIVLKEESYEGSQRLKTEDVRLGPIETIQKVKARRIGECKR